MAGFVPLIGAWAVVTAAFAVVVVLRYLAGFREADVVILDPQETKQAAEQQAAVAKVESLNRWAKWLGLSDAALTLVVGGVWVYWSLTSRYGF